MKCPDCGQAVEKTDQFCPKCYARIEPPSLWRRLVTFLLDLSKPGPHALSVKKTVTIKTLGRDGSSRDYQSLAEAPLGLQKAVEALESELMKETSEGSAKEAAETPHSGFITRKTVSVYRIKDASGQERTYHSLEELPPEMRALLEKMQRKKD